jgi:hypothetical protein
LRFQYVLPKILSETDEESCFLFGSSNKTAINVLNLLNMESEDPKSLSFPNQKRGRPQSLYYKSSEQTQRRKRAQIYANPVEFGGNHEEAIHLLQSTLRQRSFFLSENPSILETLVRNIQWILSNSPAPNPFKSIFGGLLTNGLTLKQATEITGLPMSTLGDHAQKDAQSELVLLTVKVKTKRFSDCKTKDLSFLTLENCSS